LNPRKNIEVGFTHLPPGNSIDAYSKKMLLPDLKDADAKISGNIRTMRSADIPEVFRLYK